jgi:hypothetical protein
MADANTGRQPGGVEIPIVRVPPKDSPPRSASGKPWPQWTPDQQAAAQWAAGGSAAGWGFAVLTGAKAVGVLGGIAYGAPAVGVAVVAGGVAGLAALSVRRALLKKPR